MAEFPRTIAKNGSVELVVKKSRFIGSLFRVASEEEARATIEVTRKRFWDANHNCSAYRIGPGGRFQRSNDDGEPAGTAGAPMLAVLNHRDLTDVLAIVTRYFGVTLLGAGGLIRAYGQAVSDAVNAVGIVERCPIHLVEVEADYAEAGKLEHAIRASRFDLGDIQHGARVAFQLRLVAPRNSPNSKPGLPTRRMAERACDGQGNRLSRFRFGSDARPRRAL